ncbi:MAG: DUF4113 domain-containing protein, partial [Chlamydiia bacterium]|nr:DUF4113 domain-containing protein [Chlamydiia bacterium]
SYTPDLLKHAHKILDAIFQESENYKRAGVLISDFVSREDSQLDFFAKETAKDQLMQTVDQIQARYGEALLSFAGEGVGKKWKSTPSNRSPSYTTSWKELLKINVGFMEHA